MLTKTSSDEKYFYCANTILNIAAKENIRIFSFASSFSDTANQAAVSNKIAEKIQKLNKKVLFLDMNKQSAEEIQKQLDDSDENKDYDFIFVNLLPVDRHFAALQTAMKCGNMVLLEKYTRTKHRDFDLLLNLLRQNEIHVCGVVTY